MDLKKQKGEKIGPIKDICNKCKYSMQGLAYCYKNETSFIIETIALVGAIIMGLVFNISPAQWVFSLLSLLIIMEVECLNTGIEATVDMVTKEYNPYAKIAKDCGSAATCVCSIVAAIVHLFIYVPLIIALF